MKYRLLLGIVGLLMLAIRPAYAVDQAVVVSDCSTVTGLTAGQISGVFMDVTGHICTNASSSGSTNATIVAPLGSQPAASSVSVAVASDQINNPIPAQAGHGVNIGGVEGLAATGASVAGNPLQDGCRAATAAPTAVANGQAVPCLAGVEGKQIVLPYAIKELDVYGTASTTGTGATEIIAAPGTGSIYVTAVSCFRTDAGASLDYAVLNDSASTPVPIPAGSGSNTLFPTPLKIAATTHLTFAPHTGATTEFCSAQGYTGP